MKAKKAFLAKVLAAAIAVTSILPNGLVAEAATIETVETVQNLEADENWSTAFETYNDGGVDSWHLVSGTGHANNNNDYANENSSALVYTSKIDLGKSAVGYDANKNLKMSYEVYPNGNVSDMKFGMFLKYVDTTHWAYLGYDHNAASKWFLEYNLGSGNDYPDMTALNSFEFEDHTFTRIEFTYKSESEMDVEITSLGKDGMTKGETVKATINDQIATAGNKNNNNADVLKQLEDYATGDKKVRTAFRIGTSQGGTISDINVSSFKSNFKDLESDLEDVDFDACGWTWAREADGTPGEDHADATKPKFVDEVVGGIDYRRLNAVSSQTPVTSYNTGVTDFEFGKVSAVVRSEKDGGAFSVASRYADKKGGVQIGWNGTNWEYKLGNADAVALKVDLKPETGKDYLLSMEIDRDNELTASVKKVGENEKEVSLIPGGLTDDGEEPGTTEPGATDPSPTDPSPTDPSPENPSPEDPSPEDPSPEDPSPEGPSPEEPEGEGEENKGTEEAAKAIGKFVRNLVKAVKDAVTPEKSVSVKDIEKGSIAVTAGKGVSVLVRDIEYTKKSYSKTTELEAKYNEVAAADKANLAEDNGNNKFFTEAWTAFKEAMSAAKAIIDDDATLISPTDATEALGSVTSAWETLEGNIVQESQAYTDLKAKYDEVKDLENDNYIEATWTAFTEKRDNAKTIIDGILDGSTPYANEQAITDTNALAELTDAFDALDRLAGEEDKAALQTAYDDVKDITNDNGYYTEVSWTAFETARNRVKELLDSETATQNEISEALDALSAAKLGLTFRTATTEEKSAFESAINGIKAEVDGKLTPDEAYNTALAEAEALINSGSATKKELDEALAKLKAAKDALKPVTKPDENPGGNTPPGGNGQVTPPVTTPALTNGKVEKVGTVDYQVSNADKKEVIVKKGYDGKKAKKVTIPAEVTINGVSCTVVEIAPNAFKGYTKMKSVTIGKNVRKIGKGAFAGCKKLSQVTFKGSACTSIGKQAFSKTSSKMTVKIPKALKKNKKQLAKFKKQLKGSKISKKSENN